jgi:hypothetical protein
MAITIPIISEFADKGVAAAEAAFGRFKTEIGKAEGAMGKMKAGFGVASEFVKTNAAEMAAVAGAAIAGFALKAIGDFKDLALEVDKFADATGLTLDQASRWTEVAGDIDVDATTIKDAINKMNRAAADGSKAFGDLGIDIKKFKDGEYDPQDTFLKVIDQLQKIEDPAKRAKVATEILGKGWTAMADLIEKGSSTLSKSLAEVSDAKIIDREEVQKAEDYRDAMDKLNGVFEDFVLQVGDKLIPIFTNFVDVAGTALGALDNIGRAIGNVKQMTPEQLIDQIGFEKAVEALGLTNDEIDELIETIDPKLVPAQRNMEKAWKDGYRAMIDSYEVMKDVKDEITDLGIEYDILKGKIDDREAWRNLQETIERAGDAAVTAFKEKTPESLRDAEGALDDARLAAAKYILELDNIPEELKTQIIANLDQANLGDIERTLAYLARPRVAGIIVGVNETPSEVRGRQAMSLSSPGTFGITPTSTSGANVTVNVAGSVVTQNDLIESVRKGLVNAQRNGAGLVYSNS